MYLLFLPGFNKLKGQVHTTKRPSGYILLYVTFQFQSHGNTDLKEMLPLAYIPSHYHPRICPVALGWQGTVTAHILRSSSLVIKVYII